MNISIHHSETICNSLKENHLYEILSEPERNYVPSVLLAMFSPDYHGKTVDLEKYSDYHRTSISRFCEVKHGMKCRFPAASGRKLSQDL